MPKHFIRKYLPKASTVKGHRSLRWLGNIIHDSNLWHLNRRSVASAMFAGVFACFMPIPGQMLLAASLAIYFHCNLPLSLALTWISNPLTYAPIYYLCYRFGLILLGLEYDPSSFEWTVDAIANNFMMIMKPLMIGCIVAGLLFGALAYMGVRMLWRLHIQRTWFQRKAIRAKSQIGNVIKNSKQKIDSKQATTSSKTSSDNPENENKPKD